MPEPSVPVVVVASDEVPKLAQPAKAPTPRSAPKWETDARERVKAAIKKFAKPLSDLVARDANEGDTRLLITDFLCDALGYDKYEDLTTEYEVKGDFADYGVRIDKDLVAFIEVKRVTTKLTTKHLRQVQMYAVNEGVEWLILTSGAKWQVYHLTGGLPVLVDLAFSVDLLGEETVAQKANQLFYISKESLKRRQIDELWKAKQASSPKSLANVVLTPAVADTIRKELRRSTGQNIEASEIVRLMRETVIRPECFT
jgi:predicted type IV restriction endonuclease